MDASVVVDASVWVSWLRPQYINHIASGIWLDQYIAKGGLLVEAALLLIEVAASISRRTGQAIQAKEAINTLRSISKIQIASLDSALVQVAVDAAIDLQTRAGDSIYVALAYQLNLPLVSWDREQLQRAKRLIVTYTPDSYSF
jgi:predicted nucleic acid-binding protein